jgi:hypothetical protein
LARSWNSAHNFGDDASEFAAAAKFPIETYHGLDEATAKRIKTFEAETMAAMRRSLQEMEKSQGGKKHA